MDTTKKIGLFSLSLASIPTHYVFSLTGKKKDVYSVVTKDNVDMFERNYIRREIDGYIEYKVVNENIIICKQPQYNYYIIYADTEFPEIVYCKDGVLFDSNDRPIAHVSRNVIKIHVPKTIKYNVNAEIEWAIPTEEEYIPFDREKVLSLLLSELYMLKVDRPSQIEINGQLTDIISASTQPSGGKIIPEFQLFAYSRGEKKKLYTVYENGKYVHYLVEYEKSKSSKSTK